MAPIRILQIVPAMNVGGLETFIMNVYRNIDRKAVQFDFLSHYKSQSDYDDEIQSLGGRIFYFSVREDNNLIRYLRMLDRFFQDYPEYRVIHGHFSGFGMFYNRCARKRGVAVRAGHSHSAGHEKNLNGLFDMILSSRFKYGTTKNFSCGQHAGEKLFGSGNFELLQNGIDIESFSYDDAAAARIRKELGLSGRTVYGNVGRLARVKNQTFILDVFKEVALLQPDSSLLLVGDGALRRDLISYAVKLDIGAQVVFAGRRNNMANYLSAMNAILFPSFYEGAPLSIVEAQANGLPCFVSKAVPSEMNLSDNFHMLSLDKSPRQWAEYILSSPLERTDNQRRITAAGYDISNTAKRLEAWYLESYFSCA